MSDNTAKLVIYRPWAWPGAIYNHTVFVNGEKKALLANGQSAEIVVPPGRQEVHIKVLFMKPMVTVETLQAGETLYLAFELQKNLLPLIPLMAGIGTLFAGLVSMFPYFSMLFTAINSIIALVIFAIATLLLTYFYAQKFDLPLCRQNTYVFTHIEAIPKRQPAAWAGTAGRLILSTTTAILVALALNWGLFTIAGHLDTALLKRHALAGDFDARSELAYRYYTGFNAEKSIDKSIYWLSLDANKENPEAMVQLAGIYFELHSYEKARAWLLRAANKEHVWAQNNLAYSYFFNPPQDYEKALYWWQRSSKNGLGTATYSIGEMYYLGKGVPKDLKEAYKWVYLSTLQGYDQHSDLEPYLLSKLEKQLTPEEISKIKKSTQVMFRKELP